MKSLSLKSHLRDTPFTINIRMLQIAALKDVLIYLCNAFQINRVYNPDIFDISKRAFAGENGIFTHNSVRKDKWDMYPCPRMIAMLSSLGT